MSKKVVTGVTYTYGSISGCVNYMSVSTDTVPDSSDLSSLKSDLSQRINKLEKEISDLKLQNESLISLVKSCLAEFDNRNDSLLFSLKNITKAHQEKIVSILEGEESVDDKVS